MVIMLINLLIILIIMGLLYFLVLQLPLPEPFTLLVRVVFVLIAIFVVLSMFGVGGLSVPRLFG